MQRFLALVEDRRAAGLSFAEAMLAGYTAVLASPGFVFLDEKPGRLDDYALATRLALFLWNSVPDDALRARAARGELQPARGACAPRPSGCSPIRSRAASSRRSSITGSTSARWRTPRLRRRSTTTTTSTTP